MRLGAVLFLAAVLALMGTTASADSISSVIFRIEATNDDGSAFYEVNSSELSNPSPGVYTWSLAGPPVELYGNDGLNYLATLNQATLTLAFNQYNVALGNYNQIGLTFNVDSGSGDPDDGGPLPASDTTIRITTATLGFGSPLPAGFTGARATGALTVTDNGADGASMSELGPGDGIYGTYYNGATKFAGLVNDVTVAGGSGSNSQTQPNAGPLVDPLGVAVTDISSELYYTLTPNDQSSGTVNYWVVPEPTSLLLIAVGLAAAGRRR